MAQGSALFSPLTLRGVTLRNRIVVSPMWQYKGVDGFATDWHLMHLGRFAAGGAGLVIQEGTSPIQFNNGTAGDLGLWADEFIEPLSRIAKFITDQGSVPGIQFLQTGRKARGKYPWHGRGPLELDEGADWQGWEVVGATDTPHAPGYPVPRMLSTVDIADTVAGWARAAARADTAGYEVLELQGGHGYLIHEFLSAVTNTRTDKYGGSFENRIRFLVELVEAIRRVWPDRKALFVRLSAIDGDGWDLEDSITLALTLKGIGVDLIDCSSGGMGATAASPLEPGAGIKLEPGYQVPLARAVRLRADIATMAVGLIVNAQQADDVISSGSADLVAMGRELLLSPNWPLIAEKELEQQAVFSSAPVSTAYYLAGREKSMSALSAPIATRALL
ncbi:NADH:flavin oxidoreductase/NADH oxidase [Subtercola sp. PAMC28395]|uniref:NADH:flavin oxidoreductase/NADH oxidase n=1 Tax=Subtercola sp. PAMC28395 TaxID=2846775 RepID=UPI001C0B8DEC|nr:NADH:flavin oxidoreductase/NADH oxidase [Subtercola sp. PAMC28395]QWT24402.1 NADH:flavin oxidoreductase/NADH oxidase [Subtercola sp. PAMC28395]